MTLYVVAFFQRTVSHRSAALRMACPLTPMGANIIVTMEDKKGDGQVRRQLGPLFHFPFFPAKICINVRPHHRNLPSPASSSLPPSRRRALPRLDIAPVQSRCGNALNSATAPPRPLQIICTPPCSSQVCSEGGFLTRVGGHTRGWSKRSAPAGRPSPASKCR